MYVVHVVIVILIIVSCVRSDTNISDDEYKLLPPIFHIDPYYDKCLQERNKFCNVHIKLMPLDPKNVSRVWKTIEETKKSREHYNHDELFHAICINNHSATNISKSYLNIGFKTEIIELNCKMSEDLHYKITFFDICLLWIVISYMILIVVATLHDLFRKKNPNKYLILFSVRHSLVKLKQAYDEMKVQKLKCIQGIRFYTMILVILGHTYLSFVSGYIADTKYLEDFSKSILRHWLRIFFMFVVQTFFLVSAWLLSLQTFKIFEKSEQINGIKFVLLTFRNRYFRLVPLVLWTVCLASSVWIYNLLFNGPIKNVYSDTEIGYCQKNWWTNLLFINNHYNKNEMCYITSWYLAADFQLYTLSLVLLILMWRFKRYLKVIMGFCVLIGVIIPSLFTYIYDLDFIYRLTPKNSKFNLFRSFEFSALHFATYANLGTYMVGLIFGYVYFKYGEKPLFTNRFRRFLWWIAFLGLPSICVIIPTFEYNKITSAILAGILKPIFALGIGIGILGMSQQIGGLIRRICEWKPALFLGNITYSTYLVQYPIIFYRTATATKPLHISDYILFTSFIQDVVLSFIGGFFIYLLLEMPASQMHNLLIPKFKTHQSNFIKKKIE